MYKSTNKSLHPTSIESNLAIDNQIKLECT